MRTVSFQAMGSPCRIVVDGGPDDLIVAAHKFVDRLELRWSRFLPDSEISRLNRNSGNISIVSPETLTLITRAVEAQTLTAGRFNPLMANQLASLGYATPWQDRDNVASYGSDDDRLWPATNEPIVLFPDVNAVQIPKDSAFDPGGIGKGLAADLVTGFLNNSGAHCTSVELGGDVRVSGEPWYDTSWHIGVANPFDTTTDIAAFAPRCGAVATSSTLRRRWIANSQQRHHLLDPATGRSAETDLVSATACSTVTWWAEVAAKVALMAGSNEALALLREFNTPGIVITADGRVLTAGTPAMPEPIREEMANT